MSATQTAAIPFPGTRALDLAPDADAGNSNRGGLITLWLAITSFDGLVADDYYKQGLAINQTLARADAAQELRLVGRWDFRPTRFPSVWLHVRASSCRPGCW